MRNLNLIHVAEVILVILIAAVTSYGAGISSFFVAYESSMEESFIFTISCLIGFIGGYVFLKLVIYPNFNILYYVLTSIYVLVFGLFLSMGLTNFSKVGLFYEDLQADVKIIIQEKNIPQEDSDKINLLFNKLEETTRVLSPKDILKYNKQLYYNYIIPIYDIINNNTTEDISPPSKLKMIISKYDLIASFIAIFLIFIGFSPKKRNSLKLYRKL